MPLFPAPAKTSSPAARRANRRRGSPLQLVAAAALLACAVALCLGTHRAMEWETRLAARSVGLVMSTHTLLMPSGDVFYFDVGTGRDQGLRLTLACSVVLLLVPLLSISAVVLAAGRARMLRVLTATVCASAALVAVNQIRLLVIAEASRKWGDAGFGWAHSVAGSFIVLAGVAVVLIFFFGHLGRPGQES
ncbi:exosortase/archaeosortase family protein [Streptomyces sp. NPDC056492]|uniref:exosortase/archaeosortase family protein n=1 Tax=unclassified Streptomyces TaxID=2593676 RepID=UPI0036801495